MSPSASNVVNASGASTYTTTSCRNTQDNEPKPKVVTVTEVSNDTIASFSTNSITPSSPTSATSIDISPATGSGSTIVSLYDPSGKLLQSSTVPAGSTGGVGYWNAGAATGVYHYTIAGMHSGNGVSECDQEVSSSTRSDAQWTGNEYF